MVRGVVNKDDYQVQKTDQGNNILEKWERFTRQDCKKISHDGERRKKARMVKEKL